MTGNKSAASNRWTHSSSLSARSISRPTGTMRFLSFSVGLPKGGPVFVDPSGKGFEVGEGAVDGAVGKSSASRFLDFAAQSLDEGAGETGGPGNAVIVARLQAHKCEEAL